MDNYHLGNTTVCEDIAGMNKSIEHFSCLFNQVTLVRIILQLFICKRKGRKCSAAMHCDIDKEEESCTLLEKH